MNIKEVRVKGTIQLATKSEREKGIEKVFVTEEKDVSLSDELEMLNIFFDDFEVGDEVEIIVRKVE